jgi:hypothetical protein
MKELENIKSRKGFNCAQSRSCLNRREPNKNKTDEQKKKSKKREKRNKNHRIVAQKPPQEMLLHAARCSRHKDLCKIDDERCFFFFFFLRAYSDRGRIQAGEQRKQEYMRQPSSMRAQTASKTTNRRKEKKKNESLKKS